MILGASKEVKHYKGIEHKTGEQIIKFLNDCLNEQKTYREDFFGSRSQYVTSRLNELNGSDNINKIIARALDPTYCEDDYLHVNLCVLNRSLTKDGFVAKLVNKGQLCSIKVSDLSRGGIEITNQLITSEFIKEQIEKCNSKIIDNDLDGAVTNARTLVEAILEDMAMGLDKESPKYNGNLPSLYKRVSEKLNLHSIKEADDSFKKIISGLITCIQGFAEASNKISDRHPRKHKLSRYQAEFVINTAFTISNFLLEAFKDYKNEEQVKSLDLESFNNNTYNRYKEFLKCLDY